MNKIWNSSLFWLKLSVVAAGVWLVLVASVSLVLYFSWGTHHREELASLVEFSTLLFIIPSMALFGLINSAPLIIQWLTADLGDDVAVDSDSSKEVEESGGSYRSMAEQLEIEES